MPGADNGGEPMDLELTRHLLRHYLAAIAYRTQKALRDAPEHDPDFSAGNQVRTPVRPSRQESSRCVSITFSS